GENRKQTGERAERHQREAGNDAGESEQNADGDREPVEQLDNRRCDEPFPLEQVAKIEHGVLLPTQGCRQLTQLAQPTSRFPSRLPASTAPPRRSVFALSETNTALRHPDGQLNRANPRG